MKNAKAARQEYPRCEAGDKNTWAQHLLRVEDGWLEKHTPDKVSPQFQDNPTEPHPRYTFAADIDMLYTPSTHIEFTTVAMGRFVAAVVLMAPGWLPVSLSRAMYFDFSVRLGAAMTVLGPVRTSVST